ncbi:beta-ketoacyl synthase N-terminal-like domain-containing protein [Halostagnicola sp. A-GB9-2]|uniref:thiolase C-terminal domain-containing protein n=1 Tax=Halostagnicola sp. A-GB9-2 TaxID=3048066 RepID=UPI0024BFFFE9|nr:beta-ketoacyl synthase N-terminal-like domain-containing protein [Halostagnicola sp. A-GB9-2]MDJ1432849.1 beta-ketoacyl synthase N-terminal-like domain-containing protein [Halostagnicola sp. A-GB9-2]
MTRNVAIVGGGQTSWGDRDASWKDLAQEGGKATFDAVPDIGPEDIEGLFVGAVQPERFAFQSHVAPMVAELLGIDVTKMIARTELACASGQAALRYAWLAIAAGQLDVALVLGVEKMNLGKEQMPEMQASMSNVLDREFDGVNGLSAPPFFAWYAQRHMHEYGTTREQLSQVAAKNKSNAAKTDFAQFQREIEPEDVTESPEIAPPLHLYDCSGITDGASGVIVMSEEKAREVTDTPAWITGSGQSSMAGNSINNLPSYDGWPQAREASQEAYDQAGIEDPLKEIDVAEVHDCFSISEIIEYEELGWVERGEGGQFIEDGRSHLDGDIAVNPRGGLLGCGHPLGATGVSQALEITNQFQGTVSSDRQVEDATTGLIHNLSGSASVHSVMTLGRDPQ